MLIVGDQGKILAGFNGSRPRLIPQSRMDSFQPPAKTLPRSIGRVYDSRLAEERLGFRCETGFTAILQALRNGTALPFIHDADYLSPKERA